MAIGFSLEDKKGGNFLPVIKFDAKAGDFIAINREPQSDGTWEKNEVEIEKPFKFVIDMENLQIGWISFKPGAVDFTMVHIGEKIPARPTDDHKQGIRARIFMKDHGLREFSHTSKNVLRAFDALHDQYMAAVGSHPDKMAVVEVTGTDVVKMQTKDQGELRFRVPRWNISGWVDPPAAFAGEAAQAAPTPAAPAPAAKKAMPAPKALAEDIEEF